MRISLVLLALALMAVLAVLVPRARAQTTPLTSALCIGFDTTGQIPGKVAETTQEWMNQQLSSGRSRFVTVPQGKGMVLCAW